MKRSKTPIIFSLINRRLLDLLFFLVFFLLPYTHPRFIPLPGQMARPYTTILCFFIFLLFIMQNLLHRGLVMERVVGWEGIRWMGWLVSLATLSLAVNIFHGSMGAGIYRWIGYPMMFSVVYILALAFERYGEKNLNRWIALGYLPVFLYGLVESLSVVGISGVRPVFETLRWLVTNYGGINYEKLTLTTAEPSFLGFQALLLLLLIPQLKGALRFVLIGIVLMIVIFSKSGNSMLSVLVFAGWFCFLSMRFKILLAGVSLTLFFMFFNEIAQLFSDFITINRIMNVLNPNAVITDQSAIQRIGYWQIMLFILWDTYGIGIGIGQYPVLLAGFIAKIFNEWGGFWVGGQYAGTYFSNISGVTPWSLVLGIGVDLGLIGVILFGLFVFHAYQRASTNWEKALIVGALSVLMGGHSMLYPHIFIMLTLIILRNTQSKPLES